MRALFRVPLVLVLCSMPAAAFAASITSATEIFYQFPDRLIYSVTADNNPTDPNAFDIEKVVGLTEFTLHPTTGELLFGVRTADTTNSGYVDVAVTGSDGSVARARIYIGTRRRQKTLTSALTATAAVGQPFEYTIRGDLAGDYLVVGIQGTQTANLPAGLTHMTTIQFGGEHQAGDIFGTPTEGGVFAVALRAFDQTADEAFGVLQLTVSGGNGAPTKLLLARQTGLVGQPYRGVLGAAGALPLTFSASGLPPGLTLGSDGIVTGTPTTAGIYTVSLAAANAEGSTSTTVTMAIAGADAPLSNAPDTIMASLGEPFSYSIETASAVPYYYKLDATLPAGISFNGNTLSGVALQEGTFVLPLTLRYAGGTIVKNVSLVVAPLNPGNAPATVSFSDSYQDILQTFREEGDSFVEIAGKCAVKASATLTPAGFDPASFTAETPYSIALGTFNISGKLGNGKFTAGKSTVFTYTTFIGDSERPRKIGATTIGFSSKGIAIKIQRGGIEEGTIISDTYVGQTFSGKQQVPVRIAIGDFSATLLVNADIKAATTTKRIGSGEDVDETVLSKISAKGAGKTP